MDFEDFTSLVEAQIAHQVGSILSNVPYAEHLTAGTTVLDDAYYIRHRIETVKRIRLTSKTDALALAEMIDLNYDLARQWNDYTSEEMNHDLLFIHDLEKHGCTSDFIETVRPFPSTTNMIDFLTQHIRLHGPISAVAYSVFVEWNSERASGRAVARAEHKYSSSYVSGAKAHLRIDENHGHYQTVLKIAHALIKDDGLEVLTAALEEIAGFFSCYFRELYEQTIQGALLPDEIEDTPPATGKAT